MNKKYWSNYYPTKKAKYFGKLCPWEGAALVSLPDGSVVMVAEIFAGVIRGSYSEHVEEVEFFV